MNLLKNFILGLISAILLGWGLPLLAQVNGQVDAPPDPTPELRGVWLTNIDSDVLFSRQNLRNAIVRLDRLNFNTIYPVVYNDGYTLFPSRTMQKYTGIASDPHAGLQGRDVLTEEISHGRTHKIAVLAWLEYGLMAPENSQLVKLHPEWVTQRRDGTNLITFGENNQVRVVRLNPVHPEVQNFILELVQEIIQKYPLDGIQFDDHFGLPVDMGYDEYTIARYQQDHDGNPPPADHRDPEWMAWRAKFITDLWSKIFSTVRQYRPQAILSLAPNPAQFSYSAFLQDWLQWARQGMVDELVVQVYRDNMPSFLKELNAPELMELRSRIPISIGVLTGLRIKPIAMELISEQVQTIRKMGFDGFSYFFYQTLGDRDVEFQALQSQRVPRPLRDR